MGPGADLTRADLAGADLTKLDLTGVDLWTTNQDGADLTRSNLTNILSGPKPGIKGIPTLPSEWKLISGFLFGPGTNLLMEILPDGLDLTGVNLTDVNLTGTDLTGVTWSNTTCPDGTVTNTGC